MEKPGGFFIPKKSNKESSWEELAFAEDDAAGSLWPPRSYACSFCRREFRSAQALGGHMNVHRRDRARLKQSDDQYLFSNSSSSPEHPSDHKNSETSCYTLVFNSKPNRFKSQHSRVIDLPSSPSSLLYLPPSRLSSGLPQKKDTSSSSSYPFAIEPSNNSENILSSSRSCPDTLLKKNRRDLYETPVIERSKKRKIERDVPKNGDTANVNLGNTTDISLRMNLVIHEGYPIYAEVSDEEVERGDSLKRRRILESSSQPATFVSSLSCKSAIITRNEEIKHKVDHFEDLDLELRLGADPRKGN
ncbi:hypothetical protein Bca4012_081804 [Brassica carinata]|uniref:C2H2-type domain-containing protein n=1 Tax=Brassica carinata TaxID=52824 RepID=A0A8X7VDJ1_BRACI|nr:hypothetical protein Bca52824_029024 [Brassica carinata]